MLLPAVGTPGRDVVRPAAGALHARIHTHPTHTVPACITPSKPQASTNVCEQNYNSSAKDKRTWTYACLDITGSTSSVLISLRLSLFSLLTHMPVKSSVKASPHSLPLGHACPTPFTALYQQQIIHLTHFNHHRKVTSHHLVAPKRTSDRTLAYRVRYDTYLMYNH